MKKMIEAAYHCGVNVICTQEIWCAPFFFCTREKLPWNEFAEHAEDGETTTELAELAKKYNMVILNSIYERDSVKG